MLFTMVVLHVLTHNITVSIQNLSEIVLQCAEMMLTVSFLGLTLMQENVNNLMAALIQVKIQTLTTMRNKVINFNYTKLYAIFDKYVLNYSLF